MKSCIQCKREYDPSAAGAGYKYCSPPCRQKGRNRLSSIHRKASIKGAPYQEAVYFHDVFEKSGGRCQHCGLALAVSDRGGSGGRSPEIDHIVPLSAGGHHALYNAQILCKSCNSRKGETVGALDADAISAFLDIAPSAEEAERLMLKRCHELPPKSTSGHRGVTWDKGRQKWVGRVTDNGKRVKIGYFDSAEEAGQAARDKREQVWLKKRSRIQ